MKMFVRNSLNTSNCMLSDLKSWASIPMSVLSAVSHVRLGIPKSPSCTPPKEYWLVHPQRYPVEELIVVTYPKRRLFEILSLPTRPQDPRSLRLVTKETSSMNFSLLTIQPSATEGKNPYLYPSAKFSDPL